MKGSGLMNLVLDVSVETEMPDVLDAELAQRVLQRALETQQDELPPGTRDAYISLVLTDDAGIAALNRDYRGRDEPTDVLSFPQLDAVDDAMILPPDAPVMLGDIVVSLPRAAQQAREYGHSLNREVAFLLVHGLLHLLGYDHLTPEESREMEARQEDILNSLGLTRDET